MNKRTIAKEDQERLRKIHSLFFENEFDFPDFLNGYNCSFLIEDSNNDIIVAGGVRPIGEIVLITDKSKSNIKIGRALNEFLNTSKYIGHKFQYDSLHAFIQDEDWLNQLFKYGFNKTKGQATILHL